MVVDVDSDSGERDPAAAAPPPPTETDAYFLWELRKYVLLLATLAASVTYSAGLSPPGGFWQHNAGARLAGDPVLRVTYARRYEVFFYFNATAFVASIVIVNLLLAHSLSRRRWWLRALQAAMIFVQFGLMGAYAAGSCRDLAMSAYVLALVGLVSSYVCAHVLLFALLAAMRRNNAGELGVAPPAPAPPEAPESVERTRKYLLIFATLAATVTYQAGLSTPGGFLSSDSLAGDHLAGDPTLRGHHPSRFMAFFYLNTTAFVASLVVVMLLMSRTVTRHGFRSSALWMCTAAALIGLTGAFSVGCSRSIKTSVYVLALVVAILFYIGIQILVFWCKPVEDFLHVVQEKLRKFLRLHNLVDPPNHNQGEASSQQGRSSDAHQLLQKSRMYLLLLGILAAGVTYQAGLNPPGGFWQSNGSAGPHRYLAGDPIAMILDLFGMIGAYAAGSCRQVLKSVYISVLVVPVFLYVSIHVLVFMLEVSPACAAWREMVREMLDRRVPNWLKELLQLETVEEDENMEWKLEKSRKLLLLLAILAASLTYQAGMSPPGGFWQENASGHVGDPVLNDNYGRRYMVFFYFNATAFVASLAIIMLLVNRKLSARGIQSYALRVCVILILMGLMGAFAAGSCRKVSTSIFVFVLVLAVLLCIAFQVAMVVSQSVRSLVQKFLSLLCLWEDEEASDLLPQKTNNRGKHDLWDVKLPKYLLLLAALAAAVTYQSAMNPPGGLWGDDQTSHTPGDPILRSSYLRRYKVFFYCNATSFMASLVIMVLLLIKRVSKERPALLALHAAMILDLFGLMGAYAAGCSRRVRTSAYILALVIGVSVYIIVLVIVSIGVAKWLKGVMNHMVERVAMCFSLNDL
ncbi:hypothetical protein EJB05_29594, partial [Eragrostis curvula]